MRSRGSACPPLFLIALLFFFLSIFLLSGCGKEGAVPFFTSVQPDKNTPSKEQADSRGKAAPPPKNRNRSSYRYPELSLSFIGDIMAHNVIFNRGHYDEIFSSFKDIFSEDDGTFGNLEFVSDPNKPQSNYPLFNVHPDYLEAIIENGIEIFSLANNHICDQGPESLVTMLQILKGIQEKKPIYYSGVRSLKEPSEEWRITPIFIKGWKIGFIAITEFLNSYQVRPMVYLLEEGDKEKEESLLSYLNSRDPLYDLLVLSYHGGKEYSLKPKEEKKTLFFKFLLSGVDIVWAHHPHVLQPWEIIEFHYPDGRRQEDKLVLYSTGNFISGQTWNLGYNAPDSKLAYRGESAIFRVRLGKNAQGLTIISLDPIITANYKHPQFGMIVRPMETLAMDTSIPEPWRNYYTERVQLVRNLLRGGFREYHVEE